MGDKSPSVVVARAWYEQVLEALEELARLRGELEEAERTIEAHERNACDFTDRLHAADQRRERLEEELKYLRVTERTVARDYARVCRDLEAARRESNGAYTERNRLVALLCSLYPSVRTKTDIPGWDPEWHGCVFIELPTGQASWHFHESDAGLFAHVPEGDAEWDGHTTPEKYERVARLATRAPAEPAAQEGATVKTAESIAGDFRRVAVMDPANHEDTIARCSKLVEQLFRDIQREARREALEEFVQIAEAYKHALPDKSSQWDEQDELAAYSNHTCDRIIARARALAQDDAPGEAGEMEDKAR